MLDLTHPVETGMPVFPGDPPVSLAPHATHEADGYRVTEIRMGSHAGTHVDAPSHTEPDGRDIDDFAAGAFLVDARTVDLTGKGAREPIRPGDLPAADADLLVCHTGWSEHWGTERYRDHPYLSARAARAVADAGCHVAIDAFSVDPTPSPRASSGEPEGVPAHHALLGAGRYVVENLTNLDALPERCTLDVAPLPLSGGDGAPARVLARTG